VARRCVWSRYLENEEAKARYGAVKIQPQRVVTPRKQTNKHVYFWHCGTHYITHYITLHEEYIKKSCFWLMSVKPCSFVRRTRHDELRIRQRIATENIAGLSLSLNVFMFSVTWRLKHSFCLVIQQRVRLGAGRNTGNKTCRFTEQISRYSTQIYKIHKAILLLFTPTCFGHFDHLQGEHDTHFGRFCTVDIGNYK
jgi:hypothetical protein